MQGSQAVDLSDLLTAAGTAMGASNQRLRESGAPALLREFMLGLDFRAVVRVAAGNRTLLFKQVAKPNPQMQAMTGTSGSNVRIQATFIAAPSLQPLPPPGGGTGP